MSKNSPLNVNHGKGEDRIKRTDGTYYAIANGMYYGDPKTKKDDKVISRGEFVKLTASQASGLSESIITEKEAKEMLNKSAKGMTTKSISGE